MKTEKFGGNIENAHGKPLHELKVKEGFASIAKGTVLAYETSYDKFENIDEVNAAKAFPKDSEIVDMLNAKAKAAARMAATTAKLAEVGIEKPTLENDEQLRLKKMYEIFIASKKSPDEARALASAALGIEWAE